MNLLTKILNQRPEDPLSILESLNRTTQREWFHPKLDTMRDDPELEPTYEMAERQKGLFLRSSAGGEGEQEMEEEVVSEPEPVGGVHSGTLSGPAQVYAQPVLRSGVKGMQRECNTNSFSFVCALAGGVQNQVTEGFEYRAKGLRLSPEAPGVH